MTDPDAGKFRKQGWGQDLESNQPVVLCEICARPFSPTHDANAPGFTSRHTFAPAGSRVDVSQFGPKRSERDDRGRDRGARHPGAYSASQQPFDPVLRKALIDKGVITVEDLDNASREIQAFTQAVTGGYDARTGTRTIRPDAPEPGVHQAE